MNSVGNLSELSLSLPCNKYSSTESELSSDDDRNNTTARRTLSGISISAGSSSTSSRSRRKRQQSKRRTISCSVSSGNMVRSERVATSNENEESSVNSFSLETTVTRKTRLLPAVNSTNDLKHAIGRHRGISGTCSPSVDVALFAMFYVNDTFDDLLIDAYQSSLQDRSDGPPRGENKRNSMKKDLLSLLRKEIVYSLRTCYFCPASKIGKLVNLVKQHYPKDRVQDVGSFLGLLFQDIFKQSEFLTYSDGTAGFIHTIDLDDEHYGRKYYHNQTPTVTMQQLLHKRKTPFSLRYSKRSKDAKNRSSFINVPYPALILRTTRAGSYKDSNQLEFTQFTKTTPGSGRPRHNRVVIPNLVIDVTKLIAPSSQLERKVVQKRRDNLQKCFSIENGLDAVDAVYMEQFHLIDEAKMESRIFKGLKSAWSVAYKYIEDLAASSSHINPHDDSYSLVQTRNGNISENSGNPLRKDDLINTLRFRSSNDNISQLSSSLSSLSDGLSHKNDFDDSFHTTESKHEVKMELISIICKPWRIQGETSGAKREEDRTQFGHSVYCKAGKDIFMEGEKPQFAPWVFYQSRNGVSPQVLLIENFGKWIDSLEKHHQHVDMQEVPMEIRRVLEDSYLFIYKRL